MGRMGRPTTAERLQREAREREEFRRRAFELVIGELCADIERSEREIERYKWAIEKLREMLPRDEPPADPMIGS